MRLNERLATSFIFNEKQYEIDLSFDNVLDIFEVQSSKYLFDKEKVEISLTLLLGDQEYDEFEMFDLWNHIYESFIDISKEKEVVKYDLEGNPMPKITKGKDAKSFDFEIDAERIYSSFLQAYGINLFEQQGKMHWHEFTALLNGLPSNTVLQRVIQIRQWEPSKNDSKEYKEEMKELQDIYALEDEDNQTLEEVDETYG